MKKYFFLLLSIVIFISCEKNTEEPISENIDSENIDHINKDSTNTDLQVYDYDTIVPFKNLSKESFDKWEMLEFRNIKARINKTPEWNDKWNAWGSECCLTDLQDNSSLTFYDHSVHGMFTFPWDDFNDRKCPKDENDQRLNKVYVFKLVKDRYMSSPQIGFGSTQNSCFNGFRWTCNFVYGIDFFDDILKGMIKDVIFDNNINSIILQIKGKRIINIIFPELTSVEDISKFNQLKDKYIYINVLLENGKYKSLLDKSKNIQVYENFN